MRRSGPSITPVTRSDESEQVETPSASPKLRPGPPSPPRSSVVQLSSGKGRNGSRAFGSATKREPRHFDDEGFEIKIEDEASNGPPPMLVDGDDGELFPSPALSKSDVPRSPGDVLEYVVPSHVVCKV